MLEANKIAAFEKVFAVYNRNLIRRRFHAFRVSGLDFLINKSLEVPLIIYCNHSSWWDGLIAFQLSYKAKLQSFVMMEEKHLRKLFLFRMLGAFSVVRENPRAALKSLDYAAKILQTDSNNTLWIFPQGEILPNDLRPLKFYNGLARIIDQVGSCQTASLSMRYEFLGEFKPQIFVKIMEPENTFVGENFDIKNLSQKLTERLNTNLDGLKSDIVDQNLSGYKNII